MCPSKYVSRPHGFLVGYLFQSFTLILWLMINDSEPSQIEHDMISARMHGSCCPFDKVAGPTSSFGGADGRCGPSSTGRCRDHRSISIWIVTKSASFVTCFAEHLCQMELWSRNWSDSPSGKMHHSSLSQRLHLWGIALSAHCQKAMRKIFWCFSAQVSVGSPVQCPHPDKRLSHLVIYLACKAI